MGKADREKLQRERAWYQNHGHQAQHPLNAAWLFSQDRNDFNYIFPKRQMSAAVDEALAGIEHPSVLIAPIGRGEDLPYLKSPGRKIFGVDTSPEALQAISDPEVVTMEADMGSLNQWQDATFDAVVIPLIFHHYVTLGFDPFVREAYRLLKPGGVLIALEPSSLNPFSLVARAGKRLFGNITGQVEDEAPFAPVRLANSFRRCGFSQVRVRGAGFAHNRIPIPVAKAINLLTTPLLHPFPCNHLNWMCLFTGKKPING